MFINLETEIAKLKERVFSLMNCFVEGEAHKVSYSEGEICFIALEYFYDGQAVDIGLRIGLQDERIHLQEASKHKDYDIRTDGGNFKYYVPILENNQVKPHSDALFKFLKRCDDDDSSLTYTTISDLAKEVTNYLKKVNWHEYAKVTNDFVVLGPYEYD